MNSGNTDHLFLLNQLSLFLQAKSPAYTGKFHGTPLVKIQVDPLRPPPRINKCPIRSPSMGFPGGSDGKASVCNAGDPGSIPGSGKSPGEGNGNPLQYSCLENPMNRGAW